MADIEVIYDPAKEMATIINVDTRQGWGPAMIGPEAGNLLQAFVDSVPFDITLFSSDSAVEAFAGFLDALAIRVADIPGETDPGPVESVGGTDMGILDPDEHAAAVAAESANADAPADTDPDASTPQAVQVVPCFNCNGTGHIEFGGDEPSQRCNMCQGSGRILQAA